MHLGKSREKVHRMKSRLRVMSLRIMSRLIAQLGECQASLNILPLYICNNIHDAITAAAQEFEEIRDDEMKRLRPLARHRRVPRAVSSASSRKEYRFRRTTRPFSAISVLRRSARSSGLPFRSAIALLACRKRRSIEMRIHAASAAPAAVRRESIMLYYAWCVTPRHAATKKRTDRSLGRSISRPARNSERARSARSRSPRASLARRGDLSPRGVMKGRRGEGTKGEGVERQAISGGIAASLERSERFLRERGRLLPAFPLLSRSSDDR
jgi:hypothetical protein